MRVLLCVVPCFAYSPASIALLLLVELILYKRVFGARQCHHQSGRCRRDRPNFFVLDELLIVLVHQFSSSIQRSACDGPIRPRRQHQQQQLYDVVDDDDDHRHRTPGENNSCCPRWLFPMALRLFSRYFSTVTLCFRCLGNCVDADAFIVFVFKIKRER